MSTDRWIAVALMVASAAILATNRCVPLLFTFGWVANDFWERNRNWRLRDED